MSGILKGKCQNLCFRAIDFSSCQKSSCIHVSRILKGKCQNLVFSCDRFFLMSKILMYTREWNFKRKTYAHMRVWRYIHEMFIPKDTSPVFGSFLAEGRILGNFQLPKGRPGGRWISIRLTQRDRTCAPVVGAFRASSLRLMLPLSWLRLLNWLSMGPFSA